MHLNGVMTCSSPIAYLVVVCSVRVDPRCPGHSELDRLWNTEILKFSPFTCDYM